MMKNVNKKHECKLQVSRNLEPIFEFGLLTIGIIGTEKYLRLCKCIDKSPFPPTLFPHG